MGIKPYAIVGLVLALIDEGEWVVLGPTHSPEKEFPEAVTRHEVW